MPTPFASLTAEDFADRSLTDAFEPSSVVYALLALAAAVKAAAPITLLPAGYRAVMCHGADVWEEPILAVQPCDNSARGDNVEYYTWCWESGLEPLADNVYGFLPPAVR